MVKLYVVRAANAALIKTQPLVAVFVGGTSGICEYTLRALAATHADVGKGLRVYIVGRNASAAGAIISDCLHICPTGQFRFVQAKDLALLRDVDRVCSDIIKNEESEGTNGGNPRVDLLVMSQACAIFGPRKGKLCCMRHCLLGAIPQLYTLKAADKECQDTKEGIDTLMSLMYYSRMRVIMKLLPLLLASSLPARVISIFAAGTEGKLLPEDLSLRMPAHYGYLQARSHITYMTTLFMESLAERYRGKLSLTHVFPGLVVTPGFQNPDLPLWFRRLWSWIGSTVAWLYAIPASEAGDRTLFLATPRFPVRPARESGINFKDGSPTVTEVSSVIAIGTDGNRGSGTYSINWNGESISVQKAYKEINKEDMTRKVWEHTNEAFEEIEAENIFAH